MSHKRWHSTILRKHSRFVLYLFRFNFLFPTQKCFYKMKISTPIDWIPGHYFYLSSVLLIEQPEITSLNLNFSFLKTYKINLLNFSEYKNEILHCLSLQYPYMTHTPSVRKIKLPFWKKSWQKKWWDTSESALFLIPVLEPGTWCLQSHLQNNLHFPCNRPGSSYSNSPFVSSCRIRTIRSWGFTLEQHFSKQIKIKHQSQPYHKWISWVWGFFQRN